MTNVSPFSIQGVIYNQAYRYYKKYPKDPGYLKIWVRASPVMDL